MGPKAPRKFRLQVIKVLGRAEKKLMFQPHDLLANFSFRHGRNNPTALEDVKMSLHSLLYLFKDASRKPD